MAATTTPAVSVMTLFVTALCFMSAGAAAGTAGPATGPAAWYRFESEDALGADASGHGQTAEVAYAKCGEARMGNGLILDGRGGLKVASSQVLRAERGFALDCWARFASVSENMNIISKEGEYLLRVDPPAEGRNISFFVNVNGSLEPRVRGVVAEADRWYHIIATWDGWDAALWINGEDFRASRRGEVTPTDSAVLIGAPSKWGPVGLKGVMDEVKLYSRALTQEEVLLDEYDLAQPVEGPKVRRARFEFNDDAEGWEAVDAPDVHVRDGRLQGVVRGGSSLFLNRRLDVSVGDLRCVALRMAVTAGTRANLLYQTTDGVRKMSFPVDADGRMHSYVVSVGDEPDWTGRLAALGVAPSDAEGHVELDFVRVSPRPDAPPELRVERFLTDHVLNRARRPFTIGATVRNTGGPGRRLAAVLSAPAGARVIGAAERRIARIPNGGERKLTWQVLADEPGTARLQLTISGGGATPTEASVPVQVYASVDAPKSDYVPEPQVAKSDYLVGAHYCPLWKQGTRSNGWELIVPYPEREPVLGWYDEGDPEVADWEIKWCLEHGISYFVYCWYRRNQGEGVDMFLSHAIHEGLFNSRYESKFKFSIMWENQAKGQAGVASEEDLLENLMPFWIETYFKRPSYLKIDNKPLLFIYRPEFLIDDLGSAANVRRALDKMREACKRAGFDGLIILGEYRGKEPKPLERMVAEGLDDAFAYCWPVGGNPTPEVAIRAQEEFWRAWADMGIIPGLLTVSMGWDSTPWHPSYSKWRLPPDDFRTLCERAKAFMGRLPEGSLGSKLLLLDNWNEFGEGHYIAPHRQYGFGYLDAVRDVFTDAPEEHTDLIPEDVGLGPYDSLFKKTLELQKLRTKRVVGEGGSERGLIAWWSFDEPDGTPVVWDYSGHGVGGVVNGARRTKGVLGRALVCDGGSVTVPRGAFRTPSDEITVECWVRTDTRGQDDRWFVNNVYGLGDSGFRMGLSEGKLCWAIPRARWSHHMTADDVLPVGSWVHVAGTYDGETMRVYMNGRECGSLARGGPIHPADSHLCLGSYDKGHRAFFQGILDEVRIYTRALTPQELRQHTLSRGTRGARTGTRLISGAAP